MLIVAKGKSNAPRAASPAEVARTMMARARALPTVKAEGNRSGKESTAAPHEHATQASNPDRTSGMRVKRDAQETVVPGGGGISVLPPDALAHGRYARVTELGQGGMGRVDEVFDHVLGRSVAKKSLFEDLDEERASMLIAEAQICAQLEHPSIVPVYDLDAGPDGKPFYTMRVVRGRTLRDVLADNAEGANEHTPLAQVLGVFRQVCLAVDYAHSKGVVHRDLKPDNVIVGEFGEVYVVDWGIAHVVQGSSVKLTGHSPAIAGTPAYMAPEQLFGEGVDGRADVFALGVMLYEILAGNRPFSDESILGVRARRRRCVEEPPSQRESTGAAPGFFDALVLSCLAPDRKARPGRARVIASAIDEYLDAERERSEREREAQQHTRAGEVALAELEALDANATRLEAEASADLEQLATWETVEVKMAAWDKGTAARRMRSDAARVLAAAQTHFSRAIGRLHDHVQARRGLAVLHYRQFLDAEEAGDEEQMTHYLALAREYDTGELSLELANEGELRIESNQPARVRLFRYQLVGALLQPVACPGLGRTPTDTVRLSAGSYLIRLQCASGSYAYPLVVRRAHVHIAKFRVPTEGEVPPWMTFIPGGPFAATTGLSEPRTRVSSLPDYAIGTFPVTFREYAEFLDGLPSDVQEVRAPRLQKGDACLVRAASGGWRLGSVVVEGAARSRVPVDRELDLPAINVRWFDAAAFAAWLARESGRPFRLARDEEWEKAMRGADGRPFPMGMSLDAAFAKLRDSRPEASQPEPVGAFPLDESPYGVRDMAGGVGDWTSSFIDGEPAPDPSEEDASGIEGRQAIWRGLTWSSTANVKTNMRFCQGAKTWGTWIGFRLALSLDEHGSSELITEPMTR